MRTFKNDFAKDIYLKKYEKLMAEIVNIRGCLHELYDKGYVNQITLDIIYMLECDAEWLFWTE